MKETTGKTKMAAKTRMRKKAVTTITMTKKAAMKGVRMRARVERRPHKYNSDFCQVVVQPPRCILVPPGQRPIHFTPYRPKRTGLLKFWPIAFSKGIRMDPLFSDIACTPNLPFHTLTTHPFLEPFLHVPHPSPRPPLAPNASWKVLIGPRGQELPHIHIRRWHSIQPTKLSLTTLAPVDPAGT